MPGVHVSKDLGVTILRQKVDDEVVWNIDLGDELIPTVTAYSLPTAKRFVEELSERGFTAVIRTNPCGVLDTP